MFDIFYLSTATELTLWEKIAEWYQNSFLRAMLVYIKEEFFTVEFQAYENFSIDANAAKTIGSLIPALAIALVIAAIMTARVRVNHGRFVRRLLKNECLTPERAKSLLDLGLFRNASLRHELSRGTALRMVVRCIHANGADTGVGSYRDLPLSAMLKGLEDGEPKKTKRRGRAADESAPESGTDGDGSVAASADAGSDTVSETDADLVADMAVESVPTVIDSDLEKASVSLESGAENTHTGSKFVPKAAQKIDFLTARFYIPEPLKYRADVRFDSRGSSWAPAIASVAVVIALAAALCWLLPHVLWLADAIISLTAPN